MNPFRSFRQKNGGSPEAALPTNPASPEVVPYSDPRLAGMKPDSLVRRTSAADATLTVTEPAPTPVYPLERRGYPQKGASLKVEGAEQAFIALGDDAVRFLNNALESARQAQRPGNTAPYTAQYPSVSGAELLANGYTTEDQLYGTEQTNGNPVTKKKVIATSTGLVACAALALGLTDVPGAAAIRDGLSGFFSGSEKGSNKAESKQSVPTDAPANPQSLKDTKVDEFQIAFSGPTMWDLTPTTPEAFEGLFDTGKSNQLNTRSLEPVDINLTASITATGKDSAVSKKDGTYSVDVSKLEILAFAGENACKSGTFSKPGLFSSKTKYDEKSLLDWQLAGLLPTTIDGKTATTKALSAYIKDVYAKNQLQMCNTALSAALHQTLTYPQYLDGLKQELATAIGLNPADTVFVEKNGAWKKVAAKMQKKFEQDVLTAPAVVQVDEKTMTVSVKDVVTTPTETATNNPSNTSSTSKG